MMYAAVVGFSVLMMSMYIVAMPGGLDLNDRTPAPPLPGLPTQSSNETFVIDCTLLPETGPCKAAFEAYFYNATTQQCEYFTYGGCDGNSNRFESKEECVDHCTSSSSNTL